MQLAPVRPGDIVRVNKKGRVFEALVRAKRKGELEMNRSSAATPTPPPPPER
jgi:hypothetical protein